MSKLRSDGRRQAKHVSIKVVCMWVVALTVCDTMLGIALKKSRPIDVFHSQCEP